MKDPDHQQSAVCVKRSSASVTIARMPPCKQATSTTFVFISLLRGAMLAALETAGCRGPDRRDRWAARWHRLLEFTCDQSRPTPRVAGGREIESGQQREDAASDLAAVLAHRFWYDQRRGWRFTFPNLEQLGLIEVRYNGLADFCKTA